jgi:hypothetical protein
MIASATRTESSLKREGSQLLLSSATFTVPAGEERYVCWTFETDDAVKVQKFGIQGTSAVHHVMLSQTRSPEPTGERECALLFNPNWTPVFSTGAGADGLKFPDGVAYELAPKTQLVLQLHLLNVSSKDITDVAKVTMDLTNDPKAEPVLIGGFGTTHISLPPKSPSSVGSECDLPHAGRLVAFSPHMHQHGRSLTFEVGETKDKMSAAYKRDPFDFDAQRIDILDMALKQGQHVRVTCNFQNDTDKTITYGESSLDEMCFLGAYFVGQPINCVEF